VIDLAGDVAFEAADDLSLAFAFGGASCDVVDGGLVKAHANDHRAVESAVGLSVPAVVEPVALREARAGGDRAGAAELGEGRVGVDAVEVVAGEDEHLGGGVGADPESLAQTRGGGRGELVEQLVVRADLLVEHDPAARERAQSVLGRGQRARHGAGAQRVAALTQLGFRERL
jgi:hypothetical protein